MVTQDRTVAIHHAVFAAALSINHLFVQTHLVLHRNARFVKVLIRSATRDVQSTRTSNVVRNLYQVTFHWIMLEVSHALYKIATYQIAHFPMNLLMYNRHQIKILTNPLPGINNVMSSFLKELKSLINPLITLFTKVISCPLDEKMTNNTFTNKSLTILLFNANGLKNHTHEFRIVLHNKCINLAFITETHFTQYSYIYTFLVINW